MDAGTPDVMEPSFAQDFLNQLRIADHGSRRLDMNLRAMYFDPPSDILVSRTLNRTYSVRLERATLLHELGPDKMEEASNLHSILCPIKSYLELCPDGDEHLRFLDCSNSTIHPVSQAPLPSVFLMLGPIIEESRSSTGELEDRNITNYILLWNLSTQPTSLWIVYNYYNTGYCGDSPWTELNVTARDGYTSEEDEGALHHDNIRQEGEMANTPSENLDSSLHTKDAWDVHAERVFEAGVNEKIIQINDYGQVKIVQPSQVSNYRSSFTNPEDLACSSRSQQAVPIPAKYQPSAPSPNSSVDPFAKPRMFDIPQPFDLAMIHHNVHDWYDKGSLEWWRAQECIKSTQCLLGDGLRAAPALKAWEEKTSLRAKMKSISGKDDTRAKL